MSTIDKAIAVLEAFRPERPELGVTEIANMLDMNKVVVHRLLKSLEQHGMIEQNVQTTRYRLGFSVLRLAGSKLASLDFVQTAVPFANELRDRFGETCQLMVMRRAATIRVYVAQTHYPLRFAGNVGDQGPLHCSASGKVMLSHAAPEEVDRLVAASMEKYPHLPPADPDRLHRELDEARVRGFAYDDQVYMDDLRAMAAPIFDHTGAVVATLSLGGPVVRITDAKVSELSAALVAATTEISRQLGFHEDLLARAAQ